MTRSTVIVYKGTVREGFSGTLVGEDLLKDIMWQIEELEDQDKKVKITIEIKETS